MKVEILAKFNQYESKRHFSQKMAEAFERAGVQANVFDTDEGNFIYEWEKRKHIDYDLACSFNRFTKNSNSYMWERIQAPFISFLVDPIVYNMETLTSPKGLATCVDRDDCEYGNAAAQGRVLFMPHAVERDIDPGDSSRPYPVVFFGSSYDPENLKMYWRTHLAPDLTEIIEESIQESFDNIQLNFLQATIAAIKRRNLTPADVPFNQLYYYVDHYMRGYDRVELIRSLKDIPVHIFGGTCWRKETPIAGWSRYFSLQSNVIIHPTVPFTEAIEILKQSKICLNSVPTLRNGTHERVFTAYACGALPISSDNLYWREQFGDSIILYPYNDRKYACEKIKELLQDEPLRKSLADQGREITLAKHTWDNRVRQLLEKLPGMISGAGNC